MSGFGAAVLVGWMHMLISVAVAVAVANHGKVRDTGPALGVETAARQPMLRTNGQLAHTNPLQLVSGTWKPSAHHPVFPFYRLIERVGLSSGAGCPTDPSAWPVRLQRSHSSPVTYTTRGFVLQWTNETRGPFLLLRRSAAISTRGGEARGDGPEAASGESGDVEYPDGKIPFEVGLLRSSRGGTSPTEHDDACSGGREPSLQVGGLSHHLRGPGCRRIRGARDAV